MFLRWLNWQQLESWLDVAFTSCITVGRNILAIWTVNYSVVVGFDYRKHSVFSTGLWRILLFNWRSFYCVLWWIVVLWRMVCQYSISFENVFYFAETFSLVQEQFEFHHRRIEKSLRDPAASNYHRHTFGHRLLLGCQCRLSNSTESWKYYIIGSRRCGTSPNYNAFECITFRS